MKLFRFLVFQDLKSYYKGNLDIKANTKEEALRILKKKKQKDLEEELTKEKAKKWYQKF